jgi:hypothetical protein
MTHHPKKPLSTKKKTPIPAAMREQIWLRQFGKVYEAKCPTPWCKNNITVYDFHSGHNIPESKGGPTTPNNLIPLCSRCNLSMSDTYTFTEWAAMGTQSSNPPEAPCVHISCGSWKCWV